MKVCNGCGAFMEDNMMVCGNCQKPVDGTERFLGPELYQNYPTPQLGMKWANFLGYFSLWLSAVLNLLGGVGYLSKVAYSPLYLIVAIAAFGTAVLAVVTALKIINRKRDAKTFVMAIYGMGIVSSVLLIMLNMSFISGPGLVSSISGSIASMIVSGVMLVANNIYFNNRANVFVY